MPSDLFFWAFIISKNMKVGFLFSFFISISPCIGLDLGWCELLPTMSKKASDYLVALLYKGIATLASAAKQHD